MSEQMLVGVITPTSYLYPKVRQYFELGFQVGMQWMDKHNISYHNYEFVFTSPTESLIEKYKKAFNYLSSDKDVDLITGIVPASSIETYISEFAEAHQTPVLALSFGATTRHPETIMDYLIRHDLGFWRCIAETCHVITQRGYKRVGLISNFFETGYQMISIIDHVLSREQVQIAERVITYVAEKPPEPDAIEQQFRDNDVDSILVLGNTDKALGILEAIRSSSFLSTLPVFGSPLMAEPQVYSQLNNQRVTSAIPWDVEAENEINTFLKDHATYRKDQLPNWITLLAFEAVQMLGWAESYPRDQRSPFPDIQTPRGGITFDSTLHHTEGSSIVVEVSDAGLKKLDTPKEVISAQEKNTIFNKETGGWLSAYGF